MWEVLKMGEPFVLWYKKQKFGGTKNNGKVKSMEVDSVEKKVYFRLFRSQDGERFRSQDVDNYNIMFANMTKHFRYFRNGNIDTL